MFLRAIGTAVPAARYSKAECLQAFEQSDWFARLDARSHLIARTVLQRDNGIEARRLALDSLEEVFRIDPDTLAQRFLAHAPTLAAQAAEHALARADMAPGDIDGVVVSTCTGYLCPGLTSHVAERAGLPDSTWLLDVTGSGCGAAIPALRAATQYLQAHPTHRAAVVAVEICSAAFYISNDPGVLISLCLFGDGAAAVILDGENVRRGNLRFSEFASLHIPTHREKIRFVNRDGKLCNQLHRSVPEIAAGAVEHLLQGSAPHSLISHGGGREVLNAIQQRLPQHPLAEAHAVLRDCGNLSSPSVLLALERSLNSAPDAPRLLVSFGAGFSAHRCVLAE